MWLFSFPCVHLSVEESSMEWRSSTLPFLHRHDFFDQCWMKLAVMLHQKLLKRSTCHSIYRALKLSAITIPMHLHIKRSLHLRMVIYIIGAVWQKDNPFIMHFITLRRSCYRDTILSNFSLVSNLKWLSKPCKRFLQDHWFLIFTII